MKSPTRKALEKAGYFPEWVIADNPGTDEEQIVMDFYYMKTACEWLRENQRHDSNFYLMKRLPDGTLTTEF